MPAGRAHKEAKKWGAHAVKKGTGQKSSFTKYKRTPTFGVSPKTSDSNSNEQVGEN
jgi:hypothetical protein